MSVDEKKIARLKRLLEMTDSFTQIVAVEKKLNERFDEEIKVEKEKLAELIKEFKAIIDKSKSEMSSTFGGLRQKTVEAINRLFVSNDVNKQLKDKLDEADNILAKVSQRMSEIRDGKDGERGVDGRDGEKGDKGDKGEKGDRGEDGKDFNPEEFVKLRNDLVEMIKEEIRKQKRVGGGTSAIGVQQAMKWFGAGRIETITSNINLDKRTGVILADASGGAIIITLPPVADSVGREYHIKKIDSSANTITIETPASETIDGESSYVIETPFVSRRIISDSNNYYVI